MQHELVAVGHVARLGLQLKALEHVLVHVGMEQLVAVLAPGLGRVHGHVGVAEQLLGLNGRTIPIKASLGVATGQPGADEAEELLRNADVAMYAAKAGG